MVEPSRTLSKARAKFPGGKATILITLINYWKTRPLLTSSSTRRSGREQHRNEDLGGLLLATDDINRRGHYSQLTDCPSRDFGEGSRGMRGDHRSHRNDLATSPGLCSPTVQFPKAVLESKSRGWRGDRRILPVDSPDELFENSRSRGTLWMFTPTDFGWAAETRRTSSLDLEIWKMDVRELLL